MRFLEIGLVTAIALTTFFARGTEWHWAFKTLRSPHFDVIYRRDQRALALHYLHAAERAHQLVFPVFGEGPERTLVILQDDIDETNGLANFLPYPHIRVYPVLPTAASGLAEHGDWALELMIHEYAHILNMHPAHGIYKPLSYIFGGLVRPNAILPTWYLEGLAVYLESRLSTNGRLRATTTRAAARALTLGERWSRESITTINEQAMLTWPFGNRPYLFGGWWWETVGQPTAIAPLNQAFARRLPFLLNGPLERLTGESASNWWRKTADRLRESAERDLAAIKASNPPPTRAVLPGDGQTRAFALSPSGRHLVYANFSPRVPATVRVRTRAHDRQAFADAPARTLFRALDPGQIRWLDDDRFVFDELNARDPFVTYRELYIYDLAKRRKKRLTNLRRAQQAAPSPSGRRIAFIRNYGGRHALGEIDVERGTTRILVRGTFRQSLSQPEFRGETEILFSLRDRAGHERLHAVDTRSGAISTLPVPLISARGLRRVAPGVLFTDAGTGVRNGYLLDATGAAKPVTNTLTEVGELDFDPQTNEVVISELTADGYRLVALALNTTAPPALPPVTLETAFAPPPIEFEIKDANYNPARYLWPRYWMPFVAQVENGLMFQGLTTNADPIGRNAYTLSGSIDTITRRPSYGVSYVNSSLPTRVGLDFANQQTYLGAGRSFQAQRAGLTFRQPWPNQSRRFSSVLGANWFDTRANGQNLRRLGPIVGMNGSTFDSPLGAWHSAQFELTHQEFLSDGDYLRYGRTALGVSNAAVFGRGHRVSLDARGILSPRLGLENVVAIGERNVGGNYMVNLVASNLLMRGYPSGNFVGRKVINANFEYALPLVSLDLGTGTLPLFLRNFEVVGFTDVIKVDGGAFDVDRRLYAATTLGRTFTSFGGELRLTSTAAYHLLLTTTLGLYYGTDQRHGGGVSPFVSFGLGDLEGLKGASKTP